MLHKITQNGGENSDVSLLVKQPLTTLIAPALLTRSQPCVDPIQPTVRAPLSSEVSDPIGTVDTSKITLAEGRREVQIRIKGSSVCSCESGFHHSSVGDSILDHQVRQHIADRVMCS